MVSFLKSKKLAMYKLPERLEIIDAMPTVGDSGKIDKKVLKKDIEDKVAAEGKYLMERMILLCVHSRHQGSGDALPSRSNSRKVAEIRWCWT